MIFHPSRFFDFSLGFNDDCDSCYESLLISILWFVVILQTISNHPLLPFFLASSSYFFFFFLSFFLPPSLSPLPPLFTSLFRFSLSLFLFFLSSRIVFSSFSFLPFFFLSVFDSFSFWLFAHIFLLLMVCPVVTLEKEETVQRTHKHSLDR